MMAHFYSLLLPDHLVNCILLPSFLRPSHHPFSCAFKCPNCLPRRSQVESLQSSHHADSDAADIQRPPPWDSSSPKQRYDREEPDKSRSPILLCPQVFLTHSGKQKNFARHLFKEMERESISCFFDEDPQSLKIAEEFPPRIFEAAMKCKVAVVVLSEEFISTKWPMQELSAFVKAQNTSNPSLKILPLFFAMSPDALAQKFQKRDFLKSWHKLQKSQKRLINFDEWIKALDLLRRINGIKYIESEGEVAYIAKIVAHIRDILPPNLIYDESDVQGKNRLCQEVAKLFDGTPYLKNGVRIAGLHGVGGIGKTTIARILCNSYSKHFDGKVLHVELGREEPVKTLKRALRILCGASQSVVNAVTTIDQGWYLLVEMMYGKSVFLALDNISDLLECAEEVRMYMRAVCHGNRSMILLTARSLTILKLFIPEGERSCMRAPSLQEEEAIAVLLKLTPLELSNLTTEQKNIARKCVKKCCFSLQYHPLVLQIFGAFLYDKCQYSWADLSRWIDVPNISWRDQMQKVFSIFKGSFMSLSLQQRMIFLLLSLYLPDPSMTLEEVSNWLAVICGGKEVGLIESAIIELRRKGLIESTKEARDGVYIHDLLIAFAESEADGTGKWISLKGKDEIPSSLQEGLSDDRPRFSAMKFEDCHFESPGMINKKLFTDVLVLHLKDMRTLKILDLSSMKIVRSITIIACSSLQEIHGLESLTSLAYFLIRDCPADVQFSPGIQCLRALRHLEVHANLQESSIRSLQGPWSCFPPFQDMSHLETIRLNHFIKGPGPLRLVGCSKLQTIELFYCDITLLDLTGCLQLRTIGVRSCCNLSEIRFSNAGPSATDLLPMPGCANLDSLLLERTGGWREIPSLGGLPNLSSLALEGMGSLRELPSLDGFPNLNSLVLEGMGSLRELPSLGCSPNLSSLTMEGMDSLRELPSLAGLPSLSFLALGAMGSLWKLPSFSGLVSLSYLRLGDMGNLSELPSLSGLVNLSSLELDGMDSLTELPSLSGLSNLSTLTLVNMRSLRELPSLSGLPNLRTLVLGAMGSLRELPSISGLPNLNSLLLAGMHNLRELPSFNGLPNLSSIALWCMDRLRELPSISGLPNLNSVSLGRMDNLRELPSFNGLPKLSSLTLWAMGSLRELPSISGLPNLNSLSLGRMDNLTELPSFNGLPNLSSLALCGMANLRELPSHIVLPNLSDFLVRDMDGLTELPSLSGLPNLNYLRLRDMGSLRELPSLSGLVNLNSLALGGMGRLRKLPSLCGLCHLSSLQLWGMGSLAELPELSGLADLTTLSLDEMNRITEVLGLNGLGNLRDLRVTKCGMTETPDLKNCLQLQEVVIEEREGAARDSRDDDED